MTSAATLEKLREVYGILDGNKVLKLAQKMVIRVIKDNIPTIGNDIAGIPLGIAILLQLMFISSQEIS